MARPVAEVKVLLQFSLLFQIVLDGQEGLPLATPFRGEGIGETIGDVLLSAGRIEVWEVLRRIPTLEAFGLLLRRQRFGPAAFAGNELLEVLRFHGAGVGTARPQDLT